jgi:site-specific DNA recombinase
MRVLGLARQSSSDRGAGTITTQVEGITEACEELGYDLVHIVTDRTSGKFSAFDADQRDSAGWLTDPALIGRYDLIMVTVRDRIDRDVRYRLDFIDWADRNGKGIVTASGSVIRAATADEWNNEASAAVGAEAYRRQCGEKRAARARSMKRKGQLGYGTWATPYGFRRGPDKAPEVIPAEADVLRRIAREVVAGDTLTALCARLTADGIPTRRGGSWSPTAVSRMLGRLTEPYAHAADGSPYFLPEIIEPELLARAQAALASRSFQKAPKDDTARRDGSPMLSVAYCREGHKLYSFHSTPRHHYYRCSTCKGRMVPVDHLHDVATRWVSVQLGHLPWKEPVTIPASGHDRELADVSRRLDDIEAQVVTGTLPAASAARMLTALDARRTELEALPSRPASVEYRPTGETLGEHWATLDWAERGRMLRAMPARLTVWHEADGWHVLCKSAELGRILHADLTWLDAPPIRYDWPELAARAAQGAE